jgi:hypothetical protein
MTEKVCVVFVEECYREIQVFKSAVSAYGYACERLWVHINTLWKDIVSYYDDEGVPHYMVDPYQQMKRLYIESQASASADVYNQIKVHYEKIHAEHDNLIYMCISVWEECFIK